MTRCVRTGCSGSYEPDGYCGECGRKAPDPDSGRIPIGPKEPSPVSISDPGIEPGTVSHSTRAPGQVRLGAGLVEVPPMPPRDPVGAVLTNPQVPPHRRRCRLCKKPVGQRTGRDRGFCPDDRTPFSFAPGLSTGDLIEKRYEILGCLAYGGLGWIYLAKDVKLSDEHTTHWVVLKGLIDVHDPAAVASALREKQFLVEVNHPGIVKISDFAEHRDRHTGTTVGYIVMEYLGGRSLLDVYREHRDPLGERAPLPLTTVLAYGLEVLRALAYLHARGLVYCDIKPDNVMHVEDQVKLIDLGAVRRMDEPAEAVYGTPGYQAPELEDPEHPDFPADPGIPSDIYTVGRMLAVLSLNFEGFTTRYRHRLPDPAEAPLLARYESYHRLLLRATHVKPNRRFSSADEMREQLHLVLAEVASTQDTKRRPVPSARFTPERHVFGTGVGAVSVNGDAGVSVDWAAVPRCLPAPLVDPVDRAAGFLATLGSIEPDKLVDTLLAAPVRTPEVVLRLVDARIATGDVAGARIDLANFAPRDWRVDWYRGVLALAERDPAAARTAFDIVYDTLPGELAPKLALAAAAEWAGDDDRARSLYQRVWSTDAGYVSAAFGLARVLLRTGRPADAVAALDGVPDTSSQHAPARVAAIRMRIAPAGMTKDYLRNASERLGKLQLENERLRSLTVEVLTAKLNWTLGGLDGRASDKDTEFDERTLRRDLERAYRDLAQLADDPDVRSGLVDQANRVRPKTLL